MAALAYPLQQPKRRDGRPITRRGIPTQLRLLGADDQGRAAGERQAAGRAFETDYLAPITPLAPRRVLPTPLDAEVELSIRLAERKRARARRRARRRLISLSSGLLTIGLLGALWLGAGALSSLHQQKLVVLPGSVRTSAGYLYRVQPGDTIWSIATRLDPNGDPRPLVATLEGELRGATLQPGAALLVP